MKNIFTFIALTFLSITTIDAQDKSSKKADKQFSKLEFVKAAESYKKLINNGKSSDYVVAQLAECYYNIFNTVEAEKWYATLAEDSSDPDIIFKYSQMLKANGKYKLSNKWMNKFVELRPADNRATSFLKNPNYLPKIISKGKRFNVQNLDINSEYSDFGGTLNNNKLYITSSRNTVGLFDLGRWITQRISYGWNNEPYLDIYSFDVTDSGSYLNEDYLGSNINTKYHEGLASFDNEGNMYISRESFYENEYVKDPESNNITSLIGIYKISKGDKNVVALNINSVEYSVKNPSLSSDGKSIYFSSDMPGGYGNFDIYKGDIDEKGNINNVENLGQKVNTEGQEMFPFIGDKNNLYFSSDSQLGLGGLDVFFTKEVDGKWASVRNVGIPVNSNADDFAFNINEATGEGFVSSNRSGGKGSDDIYSIKRLIPICDVLLTANVMDAKTKLGIDSATTSISDKEGNIASTKISSSVGVTEFMLVCEEAGKLIVSKEGYNSKIVDLRMSNEEFTSINVMLDPIEKIIVAEKIELDAIYFDFDKSNIKAEAAFELDKLVQIMNKYPEMTVSIESHTDSKGPSSYNQRLSERRAKTTSQYVISKGIDSSRLISTGKGESSPVVDCTNCSKEEDQLNRRSEFIITAGNPGE
ncbi:OmpA family protein [Flavobacteriaceae bacterium]|jgi:outer membrane protein OmpA-like peptidoglycan-associated protein/tetratricopeptide (TPR) repeat protein|nr:OmpA family protein [Flavobacteriaceae bacterium]MDA9631917.1 OmpA family protein [Bacteroidota bacterium]MDA9067379.1 OmpA family protein [Flavobacteriaceae bacterium]MDB4133814.1 OmpA family protein [Flavobacteriaceae bacterium]MDB4180343.1 OmpA family protein [Flavobacteriaceae bacterium]